MESEPSKLYRVLLLGKMLSSEEQNPLQILKVLLWKFDATLIYRINFSQKGNNGHTVNLL